MIRGIRFAAWDPCTLETFMPRPGSTLFTALLLTGFATSAQAAEDFRISPTGGLYGGGYFTPEKNALNSGWTVVGRVGLQLTPMLDAEIDLGWVQSDTNQFGYLYNLLDPRINALVHLTPDHRFDVFVGGGVGFQRIEVNRPSVAESSGALDMALYDNPSMDFIANLGPGVTVHLIGPLHVRTDLRWLGSFGDDSTQAKSDSFQNLEWTLGLDLRREADDDADGDGYKDKVDDCPDEPEDFDDFEDGDGCPEYDNDGDGVMDTDDECPMDPEDRDGFRDRDGCPDPDNDRDEILDIDDDCPDDPEDVDGFQDGDGCPDPDNDGDGVLDENDECDGELETDNNYQDEDGCPDEIPQEVVKFTGVIQGITFETDKDIIRKSSERILNQALGVLTDFQDVRLEVQGHTDSAGDDDYNLDLSQRRAQAVVNWFVERGIDAGRFEPHGFGETRPIATNDTAAGKAENRRVEFQLIDQE
jgi:outer membrane protein OmpA-like peptidoglycan-associated protein/opacity protein-like surface antigen